MTTTVRVVVVNYNGGELVLECLQSVVDHQVDATMQVVVVDNASVDGSTDAIAQRFGDAVVVVRNASNDGFVAANAAMGPMDGMDPADVIMLLNPDATLEPGCVSELLAALDADPAVGAASPCMLFAHRFVDVSVHAPNEPPHIDPRSLAVRLKGVRVDGVDRLRSVHASHGVHDVEWANARPSRWLADGAVVGVPVPVDAASATVPVCLTLDALGDKPVEVTVAKSPSGRDMPAQLPSATAQTMVGTVPAEVCIDVPVAAGRDLVANAGTVVFADGSGADRGHFSEVAPPFDVPTDLFAWCGGAVALKADYLADVGLFAEELFLYYEDVDLSWRGRSRGWRYRYVPTARVRHVQGASGGDGSEIVVRYTTRNRLLVTVRNASWPVVGRAVSATLAQIGASVRHEVITPRRAGQKAQLRMLMLRLRGLAGAIAGLPGALAARRRLARRALHARADVEQGLVASAAVHPAD